MEIMRPNALININGTLTDPENAKISVFDRSYLYGDSLYEVVRTHGGVPFALGEHLRRLEESARLCNMPLSQTSEFFATEIQRTIQAFRAKPGNSALETYCRLVVSRGAGIIGSRSPNGCSPTGSSCTRSAATTGRSTPPVRRIAIS